MNKRIAVLIATISGTLAFTPVGRAETANPPAVAEAVYAQVNDKTITQKDYQAAYANYLREKYYHMQVPEGKLAEAQQAVSDRMIEKILLIDEAKRRGMVADEQTIATTLAEYDARYALSPVWQARRESMLPGLKQQLAEQDLLRQIEAIGRTFAEPTDEAVREFYKTRIELFTEPEKQRLHTILLKVDPSAPKALWDAAREEAARIVEKLRTGKGSFEDLASLHSQDNSADKGGDMGYLHRGMIPEAVQTQIDAHPFGTVGDPIDVLEGVAIFRLDERLPAKVMNYDDVAGRARELLKRELGAKAWEGFVAALRKTAVVKIVAPVAITPN